MNIRTITAFARTPADVPALGRACAAARDACQAAGYTVQTLRLALPPVRTWVNTPADLPVQAQAVQAEAQAHGFSYVALGPVQATDPAAWFEAVPAALAAAPATFASALLTEGATVHWSAAQASARIIAACAQISADGFGNLRFAALAQVPAGVPFLPAAYAHAHATPALALGLEAASLAKQAAIGAHSLDEAQSLLVTAVQDHAARLQAAVQPLAEAHGLAWGGLDFALAPYPDKARSLAGALETLTGQPLGAVGTLTAVAALTSALERAQFTRCGFNGVFLPVLEDAVLAQRAAEGRLTLNDLLLYSTVCGTGLDTVPLPGTASLPTLAGLLVDVATLAVRLHKPFTARLMPLPGKEAGDPVTFDFEFFAPSRVLALPPGQPAGALANAPAFTLLPRAH